MLCDKGGSGNAYIGARYVSYARREALLVGALLGNKRSSWI
jgi:hypothetical protein